MEDITPKLLEAIQNDFQSQFDKSKLIKSLYAKIRDGTATYDEANEFAIETGKLLSASFRKNLSEEVLPDGRMYYNIANRILNTTLTNNHKLITAVTAKVQTSLNKAAGIGLKAVIPDVNESRIIGLVNKVSSAAEFSTVEWLFYEPVVNFSQSIVDDSIRDNAEFQYKSGLSPKIVRKEVGNCCDWCKEVVGSYEYPDVPEGVYKRHRYCRCIVTYEAGKYARDVHTKNKYNSSDVQARIESSRAYQERMGIESQRQKAERKRQAGLQAANDEILKKQQKESRIEYAKNGGKTAKPLANTGKSSKIKSIDIDDFEMVTYGKNIDKKVENTIFNTFKQAEKNGEFFISEVIIKNIPDGIDGRPILQIEPTAFGTLMLNINQSAVAGKTLEEIDEMFAKSKNTVANSLEEAIKHESGHAKLIKGMRTEQIEALYEELGKIHIEGISRKAYSDGAECIAEVEVLLFRGDDVPEEAMELYNKYMKRNQND